MVKQLKWHFYDRSYCQGTNADIFNVMFIVFPFLKVCFWKASFLILLCLHQMIQNTFGVILAQEISDNRVASLTRRPPKILLWRPWRVQWNSASIYESAGQINWEQTSSRLYFFLIWIAKTIIWFRFPLKFWFFSIVYYMDKPPHDLPWWLGRQEFYEPAEIE